MAEKSENKEKRSLPARLTVPSLLLVVVVFGVQFALKEQERKIQEETQIEAAVAARDAKSTLIPLPEPVGGSNPEEAVLLAVSELKTSMDASSILKRVWWEAAYQKLRAKYPETKIPSPRALFEHYLDQTAYRGGLIYKSLLRRLGNSEKARAEKAKIEKRLVAREYPPKNPPKFRDLSDKLIELGKVEESGDSATLDISILAKGKEEKLKANLLKVNNQWFLDCPLFIPDPLELCEKVSTQQPEKSVGKTSPSKAR